MSTCTISTQGKVQQIATYSNWSLGGFFLLSYRDMLVTSDAGPFVTTEHHMALLTLFMLRKQNRFVCCLNYCKSLILQQLEDKEKKAA